MKKQTYDLEERLLEYAVRIIKKETEIVIQFGMEFLKTNEIKSRSGATSLFDVRRWAFDVQSVHCFGQSNLQETVPFWYSFIQVAPLA